MGTCFGGWALEGASPALMADGLRARSDHPTSRQINRTSLQNTYRDRRFPPAMLKRTDGPRNLPAIPCTAHAQRRRTPVITAQEYYPYVLFCPVQWQDVPTQ